MKLENEDWESRWTISNSYTINNQMLPSHGPPFGQSTQNINIIIKNNNH